MTQVSLSGITEMLLDAARAQGIPEHVVRRMGEGSLQFHADLLAKIDPQRRAACLALAARSWNAFLEQQDAELERLRNLSEAEAKTLAAWARKRLLRIARRNGVSPDCFAGLSNHDLAEMAGWKHGVLTFFVRAMAGLPEQPESMAS